MFTQPASPSGGVDLAKLNGRLLLVEPTSLEVGVQTSFGPTDAIKATVTVLDGAEAGESHPDALLFPKILVSQLKGSVGQMVLGRLGQGTAKPGQSAPWILNEATAAADISTAEEHVRQRSTPTLTSAAAPF